MENSAIKNADRFKGFSDVYDSSRPSMPGFTVEAIIKYLGKKPDIVVDIGCGTGLSTVVWEGNCSKVIGVEPSDDMRRIAEAKSSDTVSFIKGYSHETGLEDELADAAICSQSFHWMEPVSTLKELSRILKNGGVFATVDCDWPSISDWRVDKAYTEMFDKIHEMENNLPELKDNFNRYEKSKHLNNIKSSGHFRFVRELVFSNTEKATAQRLIALTESQGSLQNALKHKSQLISDDFENYKSLVKDVFGDSKFDIWFSYRMRIAVK